MILSLLPDITVWKLLTMASTGESKECCLNWKPSHEKWWKDWNCVTGNYSIKENECTERIIPSYNWKWLANASQWFLIRTENFIIPLEVNIKHRGITELAQVAQKKSQVFFVILQKGFAYCASLDSAHSSFGHAILVLVTRYTRGKILFLQEDLDWVREWAKTII